MGAGELSCLTARVACPAGQLAQFRVKLMRKLRQVAGKWFEACKAQRMSGMTRCSLRASRMNCPQSQLALLRRQVLRKRASILALVRVVAWAQCPVRFQIKPATQKPQMNANLDLSLESCKTSSLQACVTHKPRASWPYARPKYT